jgi:O-antigen/teichoic acid export membrane protein
MPFVFQVIFGEAWGDAGTLIQAVVFLLMIRFISSPLSYVWIICGRQRLDFFWQLGLLVLTLAAFVGGQLVYPDISLYGMLWIYSGLIGAWYVLCIWLSRCFAYAKIPPSRPT